MNTAQTPERFGEHPNAFGFLRLLFASLVIVSHTPELIDGDRHRELLTLAFGTMSFGELAVSGFFVISGFLITGSFLNSRSTRSYLVKRAARIYPAFFVASLFSLLVVAPLGGAKFAHDVLRNGVADAFRIAILARPMALNAFPEQHYNDWGAVLNGSMWTIQYEFLCYLLVIALGLAGTMRRPAVLALVAIGCLIAGRVLPDDSLSWLSRPIFLPAPGRMVFRLVGMFLTGASFYALHHRLRFTRWPIFAAIVGLLVTLPIDPIADVGLAMFGGFLIFATARLAAPTWVGRINNQTDISYGLYLYAWPIERLLIRYSGTSDLLLLGGLTWLLSAALGWISWHVIEKPALHHVRKLRMFRGKHA